MNTKYYDVTVIGGGPGGYVAAIRAAQLGAKVALIEREKLGGTCLNKGCIPTKTLIHGVEIYKKILSSENWGIILENPQVNITKLHQKKNEVIRNLEQGIKMLIEKNKIHFVNGYGKVLNNQTIFIETNEKEELKIKTKSIILATGSIPAFPPIPGIDNPGVFTSDDILKLEMIPEDLVVIGAGVIGLEFASLYSGLGSKVTVLEAEEEILPMVDQEIIKRILPIWKKQGIKLEKNSIVKSISMDNSKLNINYTGKKGTIEIKCDKVLIATGRKPCLEEKAIGALDLEVERGFIKVNEKMETNIPNIYAIGDIVNSPMLAHVASYEGIVAAENSVGFESYISYETVPSCIYSFPEIANIGLTEREARSRYNNISITKIPFGLNGRVQTLGEQIGLLKIIMNKEQRIIGAHIFGFMASELLAEIALAMRNNLSVSDIARTIHSHPSLSELILEGAHSLLGTPLHTI